MDTLVWAATNVLSALILPPGLLIVLVAIGLALGGKRRWARWLAGVSLAVFALLSMKGVANALYAPFERDWPPFDAKAAQRLAGEPAMIVVLGGGRRLGALEYQAHETLASASLRRTVFAAQLAGSTGLPIAVSGGKPNGGAASEAALMKSLLETSLERPVALVEDASFDTRQNALFTARAMAERRVRTAVLVTDVYHMPRAVRAFEAAGVKVVPAPVYYQASAPLTVIDFLPSVEGPELSRHVLREYVGMAWYALRRAVAG